MVSMVDVARLAGVSHQTVSRALNEPETLKQKTLDAVMDAIEKTGYRRNENARALKSLKPHDLGLLMSVSAEYGPVRILEGIENRAAQREYLLKIAIPADHRESSVRKALDRLLHFDVSAIIIISTEKWVEPIVKTETNLPLVAVGATLPAASWLSTVDIDQAAGSRLMLDHMLKHGARRIDHIAGPFGWYSSDARYEAWMRFQADHGLTAGKLYRARWDAQSGYAAGLDICADLPDAVFAANDQLAIGAIRALSEHGVTVPGDVMIGGYDDSPMGEFTLPSITTVNQDFARLGTLAVDTAISLSASGSPQRIITLPRLVVRESVPDAPASR